jgi:hypothetical protein
VKVITLHWNNAGSFGTVYRADWHGSVSTLNVSLWKLFLFASELSILWRAHETKTILMGM